jgi:hypothetical protein
MAVLFHHYVTSLQGLPGLLLSGLAAHPRDSAVAGPLMQAVVGLSRCTRGALALAAGDAFVLLARELLLNFMVQAACVILKASPGRCTVRGHACVLHYLCCLRPGPRHFFGLCTWWVSTVVQGHAKHHHTLCTHLRRAIGRCLDAF